MTPALDPLTAVCTPLLAHQQQYINFAPWYMDGGTTVYVMYDEFTDIDGTLLYNHTIFPKPGGSEWHAVTPDSTPKIYSNKATIVNDDTWYTTVTGTNILDNGDGIVECDFTTGETSGAGDFCGLVFRYGNIASLYVAYIAKNPTWGMCIEKTYGGSTTVVAQDATFVYAPNTKYHVKVTCNVNSMTMTVTGGHTGTISYSSSDGVDLEVVGLRMYIAATSTVKPTADNFFAKTL